MNQTELIYKQTRGFSPFAYTMINEWLYFCDQHVPCLFRYNLEKKTCECVAEFCFQCMNKNIFKILAYKDELWFLPFRGNNIVRFDLNKKFFLKDNILKKIRGEYIPFCDIYFEKENAFIIPFGDNPFLIKVDLTTYKRSEIDLVGDEYKSNNINFSGAVRLQNKIYILECGRNFLIIYDVESGGVKTVNPKDYNLRDTFPVKAKENSIYFFPSNVNENVVIYDTENYNFSEKKFPINNFSSGEIYLVSAINEEVWIFANKKARIYLLNQDFKIRKEIAVLNFNVTDKTIYVSGMEFEDRFFWHGHAGSPLIQVKNSNVEIVEVYEDKNIIEIYFEVLHKCKNGAVVKKMGIGKQIHKKLILQ